MKFLRVGLKVFSLLKLKTIFNITIFLILLLVSSDILFSVIFSLIFNFSYNLKTNNSWKKWFNLFFLIFLLYSSSSYIFSLLLDYTFFSISPDVIYNETIFSVVTIVITSSICSRFYVRTYTIGYICNEKKANLLSIIMVSLFIAIVYYILIFRFGIGSFGNKTLGSKLPLVNGYLFTLVVYPFSIITINQYFDKNKLLCGLIISVLWLPIVFIGARKELLLIIYFIFIFYWHKIKFKLLLVFPTSYFVIIPFFRSGESITNIFINFNEFILPQYFQFLSMEQSDIYNKIILEKSGFFIGAQSLLPGKLRISQYLPLGRTFVEYQSFPEDFAIGSNLFGEGYINFGYIGAYVYTSLVIIFFVLVMLFLYNNFRLHFMACAPLLLLIGRSDFWIIVFYLLYVSLMISLYTKKIKRRTLYENCTYC